MFLFPFAMMMGGDFSITDYFLWNELPVALGNLVGGLALTGLALYTTHIRTGDKKEF
jgi:formate/nitrite transporter FocA (FNT family)